MSDSRPPRQPPTYGYPSQAPPPTEQYRSQGPPVTASANTIPQAYGNYYHQGPGPGAQPKSSGSMVQPALQHSSQIHSPMGPMMPSTSPPSHYYCGPDPAGQSKLQHTRGPSLSTDQVVEHPPFQSRSFAAPVSQLYPYRNPPTASAHGPSPLPAQAPRQATRTDSHKPVVQSGSHPSTRSYSVSSQPASGVQGQAAAISKFDAFLRAEGLKLHQYGNLTDLNAAREGKFEGVLKISKLVVQGVLIVAEINPIAKVIATAAAVILDLEETRRSNEQIIYVILIQISDLLIELFDLRHITGEMLKPSPAYNKLVGLLSKISSDITQCTSDINVFLKRRTFVKIILVKQHEDTFKKHAGQFVEHRAEFYNVMAMFNLQITAWIGAKMESAVLVLERVDQCLDHIQTSRQKGAIRYVHEAGGIEAVLGNRSRHNNNLSTIIEEPVDFSELGIVYHQISEQLRRMEGILQAVHDRMPRLTSDKEVNLLITRHFSTWDVNALKFAREFGSTFPEDKNDQFLWMHAFIGSDYSDQIMDAYDYNASGQINYKELLDFANSRPQGWTLVQWTTCWTVGWPMSVSKVRFLIEESLRHHDGSVDGRPARDNILPEFDTFVQNLLKRTRYLPIVQDSDLRKRVEQFAMIPQDAITSNMELKKYFLASEDDVKEVCNGRVEFWIFSLIDGLLRSYANPLRKGMLVENFHATQRSIIKAFYKRARDISKAEYRSLESFAFGILAMGSSESSNQPLLPSHAPMQGVNYGYPAEIDNHHIQGRVTVQKTGPPQKDILGNMNIAFNDLNVTSTSQRKRHYNRPLQEFEARIPSRAYGAHFIRDPNAWLHIGATQIKPFRRHVASGLWDGDLKYFLRSMIGSEVLGPGTLLLYNRTVYREHGGQTYPATADPLSNIVRLGDLGYVDGAGKFRPLLNIFDESGSDCEGSLYDILMHKENRTDSDIAPLTTYQSDSFTLSATTHMSSQRRYKWTASKARHGTILALPYGGEVFRIDVDSALRERQTQRRLDQLSLMWYQKALTRLGSSAYNGALMFVSAVYASPVFYMASFFSEKRVSKAEVSLKPYDAVPRLYLWNAKPDTGDLWYFGKQPSQKELETMNRTGAIPPVEQSCALSLNVVELGQAIWDRHFATDLPNSQALYELANAPDPSVKSESSSVSRAAKKLTSFFTPS